MRPGSTEKWSRSKLTKGIEGYLQHVKGLDRSKQDFRSLKPQIHPTSIAPSPTQSPLFAKKKSFSKAHFKVKPGAIRSADELNLVIEAGGRLVIPKSFCERAMERYDGTFEIYRDMRLRETEEVTRQLDEMSKRVFAPLPSNLKVKSRYFTPRSLTPPPQTHNILETRINTMLDLINSAQKSRCRLLTPSIPY